MRTTLENKDMEIDRLKSMYASKSTEIETKNKHKEDQ